MSWRRSGDVEVQVTSSRDAFDAMRAISTIALDSHPSTVVINVLFAATIALCPLLTPYKLPTSLCPADKFSSLTVSSSVQSYIPLQSAWLSDRYDRVSKVVPPRLKARFATRCVKHVQD